MFSFANLSTINIYIFNMQATFTNSGFRFIFIFFLVSFHVAFGQGKQNPVAKDIENGIVYGYQEYLPKGYDTEPNRKWPLIIHMVGLGERGDGSIQDLDTITGVALSRWIKIGGFDRPFLVMSPQPTGKATNPLVGSEGKFSPDSIALFVDYITNKYNVDRERVYVTAFSAAVVEAYRYVLANTKEVTAFVPIAGGRVDFLSLCNLNEIPVWAFHNLNDLTFTDTFSINAVRKINNCIPPPNERAKVTIYDRSGHEGWTWTYRSTGIGKGMPAYDPFDESIYDWFLRFSKALVVNAGKDTTVVLPYASSIKLQGSSNTSEGVTYLWTQESGPNTATLSNQNTSVLTASGLAVGTYVFGLKATGPSGFSAEDRVNVLVSYTNDSLVANAGQDIEVLLPASTASLSGSGSDTYHNVTGYLWRQVVGPEGSTIETPGAASTNVVNLTEGKYAFELTVINDNGGIAKDTVSVALLDINGGLVVEAGKDTTVFLPTESVTFNGSFTKEAFEITGYEWIKTQGPDATLENTDMPDLKISALQRGDYVFQLTVTNDKGGAVADSVRLTVKTTNDSLVADAGQDISVALPVENIQIEGSGKDIYNQVTAYQWKQIKGEALNLVRADTAILMVEKPSEGTYLLELTVSNDNGGTAKDTMQLSVLPTPLPDASPVALLNPGADAFPYFAATELTVQLENKGNVDLSDLKVGYQLNGQSPVVETLSAKLPAGGKSSYTFTQAADFSALSNYTLKIFTVLPNDVNLTNDTLTLLLQWRDTLVLDQYSESFEAGNAGWQAIGTNPSWQVGTPQGGLINAAADGKNAWVTNLTGNYNNDESSLLVSPIFDFSQAAADPVLTFDLWWDTSMEDQLSVSVSTDGGVTWTTLGKVGDTPGWYTSENGWSGTGEEGSGQWITVSHALEGTAGEQAVMVRFEFTADGQTNAEGVGIDNINICQKVATVAAINDMSISRDMVPLEIPLTIENAALSSLQGLTITATSDNAALLSDENMQVVIEEGKAVLKINALSEELDTATITLQVEEQCTSVTNFKLIVNRVTGIEEILEQEANVYPNPSGGVFFLDWKTGIPEGTPVRIFSAQGALVQAFVTQTRQQQLRLDITSQAAGTYLLVIQTQQHVYRYRLVKY